MMRTKKEKGRGDAGTRRHGGRDELSESPRRRVPASSSGAAPLVLVIMGSKSDWETMRNASQTLADFGIAHECRVLSAHRTPRLVADLASNAESNGIEVIIAAAGGAAHLAGVTAAHTTLPVLGVPMKSDALNGMDSLLATVQMPAGIPVGTLAIGKPGAINAALLAIAILANSRPELRKKLHEFRAQQEKQIRETTLEIASEKSIAPPGEQRNNGDEQSGTND